MARASLATAILFALIHTGVSLATPRAAPEVAMPCKLAASPNAQLSLGFGGPVSGLAPSTGTLNAFMFFVDFSDAPATETPQSLYDFFLPDAADWFDAASGGKLQLNVTADTARFHRMPAKSDSYGWSRGLTSTTHQAYIQDALDAFLKGNSSSKPTIAPTDVLYIVPTRQAKIISFSTTYNSAIRTRAGASVAKRTTTFGTDAYTTWKFKTLNHETGHSIGLPDLYPSPSGSPTQYVGGWDMMGYINGPSPDYFAWSQWKLGWISDAQVQCLEHQSSNIYTVAALETFRGAQDLKALVAKLNDTTALVAEVRQAAGVDSNNCAPGLLLYTVSTSTTSGKGPIRVVNARPEATGCGGDLLNTATLSPSGTSAYTHPESGIKFTVLSQISSVTVQVDVP